MTTISQFTILDAMDDSLFFGPFFKRSLLRGDTWQAWRVFLAGLFALPMDSEQLALYKKHTGRTAAPAQQFNEAFAIVGRRGGKSRIAALLERISRPSVITPNTWRRASEACS